MDNVIDTNLKVIEDFKKELLEIFEDVSDEHFSEMKVELLNHIAKAYSGPEAEQAIEQLLIEGDKNGFTLDTYVQELSHTVELFSNVMKEIKEEYKDQPNKCEFCDEFMSLIEAYVLTATNKITNRNIFNVAVELCHPNAKLPTYAHDTDWGADVYAVEDMTIQPGSYGVMVPTGLRVAIPHGWMISFRPRSGMSHKTPLRLSNSPGTIDETYRGELKVLFDNFSNIPVEIKAGDRIVQMGLEKNYKARYYAVDNVERNTDRGEGGFGSSGN